MENHINNYKRTILIADDSYMNREILTMMLESRYNILQAEDGEETIQLIKDNKNTISLILLDIIMPKQNGFEVLKELQDDDLIEKIPVIIISADTSSKTITEAYNLGAIDFIARPFNMQIVQKRIENILIAHSRQEQFENKLKSVIREKEKNNNLLINILSQVVEYRNGESANHVLNVKILTYILLTKLIQITDKYPLTKKQISLISVASSLHDIGKISIDEKILNKPGKLTRDEFEIMKTHTTIGATMMDSIPGNNGSELIEYAKNICLYHHEKYDGNGYPQGLKGEEIPIYAQIVSIADCYDALTSERVYKHAVNHDDAIKLINNGECGAFNPIALECLNLCSDRIKRTLHKDKAQFKIEEFTDDMFNFEELAAQSNDKCLDLVEKERTKNRYYASMSKEIQWEYDPHEQQITVLAYSNKIKEGEAEDESQFTESVFNPVNDKKLNQYFNKQLLLEILHKLNETTLDDPEISMDINVTTKKNQTKWFRLNARTIFNTDKDPAEVDSYIGKLIDIDKEQQKVLNLEYQAHHDELTSLYNRFYSKNEITSRLTHNKGNKFALILFDIDYFKSINDNKGHLFGDMVLKTLSEVLSSKIMDTNNIIARTGGDEFIIFFNYNDDEDLLKHTKNYHNILTFECVDTQITVSMGVATTETSGYSFDKLLQHADEALYKVKNSGKNNYKIYSK